MEEETFEVTKIKLSTKFKTFYNALIFFFVKSKSFFYPIETYWKIFFESSKSSYFLEDLIALTF